MHWVLECTSGRKFGCKGVQPSGIVLRCSRNKQLKTVYQQHQKEKKRAYKQRIWEIERGSFTPLVLSATGGMGPEALIFYKKLAAMISMKRGHTYQKVVTWIRQRLTFRLLRSAINPIKATRLPTPPPPDPTMITIVTSEGPSTDY